MMLRETDEQRAESLVYAPGFADMPRRTPELATAILAKTFAAVRQEERSRYIPLIEAATRLVANYVGDEPIDPTDYRMLLMTLRDLASDWNSND
jgi:hypothetical protein